MIPFDQPFPVDGGFMDFREARSLSPSIQEVDGGGRPGIDHAFVLRDYSGDHLRKRLRHVASLQDDISGRRMDISTTECALIVYTSNWVQEQPPFAPVRNIRFLPNRIALFHMPRARFFP